MTSEQWAVTFGARYRTEEHPVDARIDADSYVLFDGTEDEARTAAFETFGDRWSFMYRYAHPDGTMSLDFAEQLRKYGLVEVDLKEDNDEVP